MKTIKLYRGISVKEAEADQIINDIRNNGLYETETQEWGTFIWKNLKNQIETLYSKEDLSLEDTRPASRLVETINGSRREYTEGEHSICFADEEGAYYYAVKHNLNRRKEHIIPLLIEANVNIDMIAIDGRDFLATVFQFIEPSDIGKTRRQTKALKRIFGKKIELYIEKIIRHPKSNKLAVYDLAAVDNEIILSHLESQEVLKGRYETIFKSAYFGKLPISSENILNVQVIKDEKSIARPTITLNDILER